MLGALNKLMFGAWFGTLVIASMVSFIGFPLETDLVNSLGSLLGYPKTGYMIDYLIVSIYFMIIENTPGYLPGYSAGFLSGLLLENLARYLLGIFPGLRLGATISLWFRSEEYS